MSEWIVKSLSELVSFQKGRKVATSPFSLMGYEPYLGAGALSGEYDGYASSLFAVQANEDDVLMLWDGERSGLCRSGLKGIVSSTVCKLTPKKNIRSDFLYYYLANNYEWIQARRTGTGVPHVPKDIGRMLKIQFPKSTKKQQEIAAILIAVDKVIEKTNLLIKKYQQINHGLMYDLFTRGIDDNNKLRPVSIDAPEIYYESGLKFIPKGWRVQNLSTACEWFSGGTPSKKNDNWWKGDIPWLSPKDMKYFDLSDTQDHITEDGAYYGSKIMPKNTTFIVVRGMILAHSFPVVINSKAFSFNQDIKALIPKDYINRRFLAYWFVANSSLFLEKTTEATHGTKRFDMKDLYSTEICIPPMDEQDQIVERLDAISEKINSEKRYRSKLLFKRKALMKDLLTENPRMKKVGEKIEASHV